MLPIVVVEGQLVPEKLAFLSILKIDLFHY